VGRRSRRYYIGIVGKYGAQVQAVLKKAADLYIEKICPLHGPMLLEDLAHYIGLYNIWSSYEVESEGIVVAYTSVYGNTKRAALATADKLRECGAEVKVYDLARSDMAHVVAEAFRYGKLVLATTTYNGDIFPYMREFIDCLCERGYKNRTVAFIENGSWAPMAAKVMKERLAACKNLTLVEPVVSIKSGVKTENEAQMNALVAELTK
jgi:flavorubredoxin